jgi:hypothetical protein
MTLQIIPEIKQYLTTVASKVDSWFDIDEAVKHYQPENGGWSICQVLEHISLTNHYLLILIEKGVRKSLNKVGSTNLQQAVEASTFHRERLDEVGIHQSFDWIRPEHMEPSGDKPEAKVRQEIREQFETCKSYLDQLPNGEGVLHKTKMTVNDLGKITVYEYIYFLGKHAERHIQQMEKVWSEAKLSGYKI